jgi:hypothetical protein
VNGAQGRPDVARELHHLKDFQRATVAHVHQRLWLDSEPAKRFLVADEVGLGKTMVARGVIAHTIDHLWDTEDRIDIVYICSNSQIARQNLSRLAIQGYDTADDTHADRLTMLPEALKNLRNNRVNFISFTPGTSFSIQESGGRQGERVLLQHMLAQSLGLHVLRHKGWLKFFRGGAALANYRARVAEYDNDRFDAVLAGQFARDLHTAVAFTDRPLVEELEECVEGFRYLRGKAPWELSRRRYRLIGQMRNLIATAAVEALEPDLVILDEFQRFRDLLTPGTPGADLAHAIFDQETARVLMLSATPYKMYTLPDEPEGDDHYKDFRRTVEFLAGAAEASEVIDGLRVMRQTLLGSGDIEASRQAKNDVQARLRQVMARTERARSSADRDGMLVQKPSTQARVTPSDLLAYTSAAKIAACLPQTQDVFEYWRSSPYVLNIMEHYQVKKRLEAALTAPTQELLTALGEATGLLNWQQLDTYQQLDPGNAKMRGLMADVVDRGAWKLLWLPPSLPYYDPGGAFADPELAGFTKRLVFSAWAVVPKAISLVLSYEAERRALDRAGGSASERAYSADRTTGLLRFQTRATAGDNARETGMPVLAILYPCSTLARLADPLSIARELNAIPVRREEMLSLVESRVSDALGFLPSVEEGAPDERWYWAAPFLLDEHALGKKLHGSFLDIMAAWGDHDNDDAESKQTQHVQAAQRIRADDLGRRPADLAQVLTLVAVAGPGVCALRALSRACGGDAALGDEFIRDRSSYISWALRSLFNRPESLAVARSSDPTEPYWQAVLRYCVDGNLQSTLDEYVHTLVDSEGLHDKSSDVRAAQLSAVIEAALTLRAATATVDTFEVTSRAARLHKHRVRSHFAVRFGRGQDEGNQAQREGQVRTAYNSPFWPFVLASTSVGQEGLDFHPYSHAVVHWNLPGNPVDLEQREGRVHRFKGHAVRRNVALAHSDAVMEAAADPWTAMFAAAKSDCVGVNDLTPYWIYSPIGGAAIERYVPVAPLSKEAARFARLLRTVGAYRLVMGQPRQEDLLRYLGEDVAALQWLHIDLTPTEPSTGTR